MADAPHPDSAFSTFGLFSSCISKHSGGPCPAFPVAVHLLQVQKQLFQIALVLRDGRDSTNMPSTECLNMLRRTTKT